MKTIFKTILLVTGILCFTSAVMAQTAKVARADMILGVYQAIEEGKESKVRFTKLADGSYQGQIFWLKQPTNADGTPKLDVKIPTRRSVQPAPTGLWRE